MGLNRSSLASLSSSLFEREFCNGIVVKKKERRIFGFEIGIFVCFVIRSVYTVYGRYYENLQNFGVILKKCPTIAQP